MSFFQRAPLIFRTHPAEEASAPDAEPEMLKWRAGQPRPAVRRVAPGSSPYTSYIAGLVQRGPDEISKIVDAIIAEEDAQEYGVDSDIRYTKRVEYQREAL